MNDKNEILTNEIYTAFLEDLGFKVDRETGAVTYTERGGIDAPVTIKGQELVVPIRAYMKKPDWDRFIAFHPVCENIKRKKSIIQERTAIWATNHITNLVISFGTWLVDLVSQEAPQKGLNAAQKKVLSEFSEIKPTVAKAITKFLTTGIEDTGEKTLINFYIKRNGIYQGEEHDRVCMVTSGLMAAENVSNKEVFGQSMTVGARKELFHLIRWLLPKFDIEDGFCSASRSATAPNFQALIFSIAKVLAALNDRLDIFGELYPEYHKYKASLTWLPLVTKLVEYRDVLPVLTGNDGEMATDELKKTERRESARESRKERKREIEQNSNSIARGNNPWARKRSELAEDVERRSGWGRDEERRRDDYDDRERSTSWADIARERRDREYDRDDRGRGRGRDRYDDRYDDRRDDRRRGRDRYDDRDYDRRDRYDDRYDDRRGRGRDRDYDRYDDRRGRRRR